MLNKAKNAIQKGTQLVQAQIKKPSKANPSVSPSDQLFYNDSDEIQKEGLSYLDPSTSRMNPSAPSSSKFKSKSKKALSLLGTQMKAKMVKIRSDLQSSMKALDAKSKSLLASSKEKLNKWVRAQVERIVVSLLAKAPNQIKDSLKDPEMPKCISKGIDDLVEEIWPDVQEEILFHLRCAIDKPVYEVEERKKGWCLLSPFILFRNWYLYTKNPCNSPLKFSPF